ncbi:MAG TPA: 8-amino-7-oxononanoate synthase [Micromonosporaceae bacterium]
MTWLDDLARAAAERERLGLRRRLQARTEDDGLIDLAGNDYLGLSRNPEVIAAASAALKAYGAGATASRLVRGSTEVHLRLELALADLLGTEAALVYSSGYLANLGAVRAFSGPGVRIASDAHNHASLVDGCRIAGAGRDGAQIVVYRHADASALDAALSSALADRAGAADRSPPAVVVTESVFSVYGDLAPLADLHAVARRHGAVLCVDDAHGLGVTGPDGAGGVSAAGLSGAEDVVVTATLSKALGAAGGVVAGPAMFIRHLVETSRSFIYDTGLPPAVAAGALAALALSRGEAGAAARLELAERVRLVTHTLGAAGLRVSDPAGGVLSVAAPGPEQAVAWAAACRQQGVAVGCFRPPSSPDGDSRLRLTINVAVPRDDFEQALATVVSTAPERDFDG